MGFSVKALTKTKKDSMRTKFVLLMGRVLLAMIFLMAGMRKMLAFQGTAADMSSKGVPLVTLALAVTILLEVMGGLSIILGFKARLGAALLALFRIPVTLVYHNFWAFDGQERQMQMLQFMKNLAIMGGLLQVAHFGPGPGSMDEKH
ncbi:MAG: DoxX family protein [Thermoanaerobaculaceae bacterium]